MARRKPRPKRPPDDYEIGYGKPPKETRWPKGFCPNRKGRPKKVLNVAAILDRLLEGKVTVRDGSSTREVSRLEYLFMKAAEKAGKGDLHSLKFLVEMRERFPTLVPETAELKEIDPDDLSIIADFIARQKDEGEDEP